MSPSPEPADITPLTLLQAIHDHQRNYDASTGWDRIKLHTPWRTLCTVYPENVVDAAYTRESSRGYLARAACACPTKCDLCFLNGVSAWLTDKGHAKLTELKARA
ncbi:hypothetical protein [Streptomyces sp. NPDC058092]|uniref:hypothetical protein n=1 Tax=Streptomyces sp. NPDC058092 TaxID=3346336 RepID=UPI0036E35AFF